MKVHVKSGLSKCPKCAAQGAVVINSRTVEGVRMRRRKCLHCPHRYTTYEIDAPAFRSYIKTMLSLKHLVQTTPPIERMKKVLLPKKSS